MKALRIFSLPGKRSHMLYFRLFAQSLERAGLRTVDIREPQSWLCRFDVLHVHFPQHYVVTKSSVTVLPWASAFLLMVFISRLLGKKIVYSVHDVVPWDVRHEWLLWRYLWLFHRLTDAFVFLSPSSRQEFYRRYPDERTKPHIMLGHASYSVDILPDADRLAHRERLIGTDDAFVVGFFGFLRPRKGLSVVNSVPATLGNGRRVKIVVAGGTQDSFRQEAEEILGWVDAATLVRIDRDISDAELNTLIQAVDVTALPYAKGWNSGMAMLVLSNGGRMIGSSLPIFNDLRLEVGAPWVYTADVHDERPMTTIADALEQAEKDLPGDVDRNKLRDFLEFNRFANGARRMHEFYRSLVRR